jgi:hypothetical protein
MRVSTSLGDSLSFTAGFATENWSGETRFSNGTNFRAFQSLSTKSFDAMVGQMGGNARSSLSIGPMDLTVYSCRGGSSDVLAPADNPSGKPVPVGGEPAAIGPIRSENSVIYALFYGSASDDRSIAKYFRGPTFDRKTGTIRIRPNQDSQLTSERYFVLERGIGLFRIMNRTHAKGLVPTSRSRRVGNVDVWRMPVTDSSPPTVSIGDPSVSQRSNYVVTSGSVVAVFTPYEPTDAFVENTTSSLLTDWV